MPEIDRMIREYCELGVIFRPAWLRKAERIFPSFLYSRTPAGAMQKEIQQHLRESFDCHRGKSMDDATAWLHTKEQFGDIELVRSKIEAAQQQYYRHLLIRSAAILIFLVFMAVDWIRLTWLISGNALVFFGGGAISGWLLMDKRNSSHVWRSAYWGAWFGLFMGARQAVTAHCPDGVGPGVALALLSAFYGLFLAEPGKRGLDPVLMIIVCQAGILIPLARLHIFPLYFSHHPLILLSTSILGCMGALLAGLSFYGYSKISRRFVGVSMFAMTLCYCRLLNSGFPISILELLMTAALSMLMATFFLLRLRAAEDCQICPDI
jgi:hypothetical protein